MCLWPPDPQQVAVQATRKNIRMYRCSKLLLLHSFNCGTHTCLFHVLPCRAQIAQQRRVVRVLDAVLLAHLAHDGLDLWVVPRGHAWEEVMLDLEVKPSGHQPCPKAPVSASRLCLCLVPAHGGRLLVCTAL